MSDAADAPALTSRLSIVPLRAAHAPLLFAHLADPRQYAYVPDAARASVAELWQRFADLERGAPPGSGERWLNWVISLRADGAPLGTLQATVVPARGRAWIGYALFTHSWGQGYATEGCAWLAAELAQRHAVRELLASVDTRNAKSIALLERLGFERVATAPATLNGKQTTDHRYRLACAP